MAGNSGELNYLGEWHTHPNIPPTPSQRDKAHNFGINCRKEQLFSLNTISPYYGGRQEVNGDHFNRERSN